MERKAKLRELVPSPPSRLLYHDHVEDQGVELYEQSCKLDLEGVVVPVEEAHIEPLRR